MNRSNGIRALVSAGALGLALAVPLSATQAQILARLGDLTPPAAIPSGKEGAKKAQRSERGMPASLGGYSPGTIVVKTRERRLYYVLGNGKAVRYPVGVGRPDKQWFGQSAISGKYIKPAWAPPEDIRRDNPRLPYVIPSGAPNNPMGAAALTIAGGEYAIHGTNRPGSVGGFVSYGCIRMLNSHILDLFERVAVGTPIVVER
jgi:lipoprotein-anchoring transpeptidase ErfK/SrfK